MLRARDRLESFSMDLIVNAQEIVIVGYYVQVSCEILLYIIPLNCLNNPMR